MDLDIIKIEKKELEINISKLLLAFRNKSGLKLVDISLNPYYSTGSDRL